MAVQFHCAGCRQPIEIDDEFAGRSVTCPFCRQVVTAPMASEIVQPPGGQGPAAAAPSALPPYAPPVPPRPNTFATAGLVCAIVVVACVATAFGITIRLTAGIPPGTDAAAAREQIQKAFLEHPLAAPLAFVMVVGSITGLVLSILGLTRRQGRRWQAIVGVTVCGLMTGLHCLGLVAGLAQVSAGR